METTESKRSYFQMCSLFQDKDTVGRCVVQMTPFIKAMTEDTSLVLKFREMSMKHLRTGESKMELLKYILTATKA